MEFEIPCDVIARLSKILVSATDPWFNSFRYDDGIVVASNRYILVAEQVGGPSGVLHINADAATVTQCVTEAKYDSRLHVSYNAVLNFATAKTTMGYVCSGNVAVTHSAPNDMDRWRSLVPKAAPTVANGPMFWNADRIAMINASSPSGKLSFPTFIDVDQFMIIRDAVDDRWFAMIAPSNTNGPYPPATVPEWMK